MDLEQKLSKYFSKEWKKETTKVRQMFNFGGYRLWYWTTQWNESS